MLAVDADIRFLDHLADPPAAVHTRVAEACKALLARHGYDPGCGRRLPRALTDTGLVDVGTHAASVQVQADAVHGVPQWQLLVDQLAPACSPSSWSPQPTCGRSRGSATTGSRSSSRP